jgi:flagellar FliL protein
MSDAKKNQPPPPPADATAPSSPKWLLPLVGMNSLLLFAVLGFMGWTMMHKPAPDPVAADGEEAKVEEPAEPKKEATKVAEGGHAVMAAAKGPGPMVRLPDFVVHLRNSDLDRYARITFEIEVMAEPDKEHLTAHMPRVRDSFISYLSDRTVEELSGSEGLGRTKDALYARVRELVPEARFRALYISDFVVQ